MGAVETMEDFFERLNTGDRMGAVSLFDERTEMRVHVLGNVRTLRGADQVSGWFLRADKGFRMIPGEVRETGFSHAPQGLNASGYPYADARSEFVGGLGAILGHDSRNSMGKIKTLSVRLEPQRLNVAGPLSALVQ